jgi:uncharacterized membrane protein
MIKYLLFSSVAVLALTFGYSNQPHTNNIAPSKPTDTTLCYERDIKPILETKCATARCHSAKAAKDDIVLDNYDNTMQSLNLSEKTNPLKNKLRHVVSKNKMPPARAEQLTEDEKKSIFQWLETGMQKACP